MNISDTDYLNVVLGRDTEVRLAYARVREVEMELKDKKETIARLNKTCEQLNSALSKSEELNKNQAATIRDLQEQTKFIFDLREKLKEAKKGVKL
jgi:small nuclear ribonucleoprotein (snRNP)-like protein